MILSAPLLTTLQRCERRYRLESTHRILRIRPKELFDRLLREAVFAISNGADPREQAESAATIFLETAARPGLDILSNPYTLAQDFCSILRTSLEAIAREVLLVLKKTGTITVGAHQWDVQAYRDESGVLHRWTAVDRWDQDAQYREVHGWHVFGDCAATGQGMWLHVVEIGRHSKGHQVTPWCRCYKHPAIANHFRFRQIDGSPLQGNWKSVWYQDSSENNPKSWVDLMERDRVYPVHHLQIRDPHAEHVQQFRKDLPVLAQRIANIPAAWTDSPLERPICDLPPCPWQPVCYAPPGIVNIEGVGGFVKL